MICCWSHQLGWGCVWGGVKYGAIMIEVVLASSNSCTKFIFEGFSHPASLGSNL